MINAIPQPEATGSGGGRVARAGLFNEFLRTNERAMTNTQRFAPIPLRHAASGLATRKTFNCSILRAAP
jgi:hypothetical protein